MNLTVTVAVLELVFLVETFTNTGLLGLDFALSADAGPTESVMTETAKKLVAKKNERCLIRISNESTNSVSSACRKLFSCFKKLKEFVNSPKIRNVFP
ncbi:MAG: hypothetical protein RIR69_1281 [Actinomycetota bacterium]